MVDAEEEVEGQTGMGSDGEAYEEEKEQEEARVVIVSDQTKA